uniref:Cytochrome c oxidase subunit 2 n=1 Tax=Nemertopsis tetraclitophila TaxID=1417004 RepID=A0A075CJF1_9BILA|nr:cytochrome c oxidase subunit II [Nemertopsis tetraclitophila]AGZ63905.1 cytochrome c oxidase subunit II [Nemertopsis tetraclitophila]
MTFWSSWGLQDASSPLMEQLIFFHDHAMLVLILIISLVGFISVSLVSSKFSGRYLLEYQEVEAIWTVLPGVVLIFLALPSLRLLYLLDEINESVITLKVVGHQWYWSYEYSDFLDVEYDSYMISEEDLDLGDYRLLEVDHRVVVPFCVDVRVLVTAADVLHSWTVPSLGVKADAVPGRLNQLSFYCSRSGVFYGQRSEICGANHSFMPIVVESLNISDFISWVKSVSL